MARGAMLVFFIGLLLGCGPSKPHEVAPDSSGEPAPANPGAPLVSTKDDLPAAEKKLGELEKSITAKEKELADLRAEADALRSKITMAKGGGSAKGGPPSIAELLGKLPKETLPNSANDS